MPAFAYTGLNAKGRPTKGVISADNLATLKLILRKQGVYLTAAHEAKTEAAREQDGDREIDLSRLTDRVTPKMVAATTRLLGTLLHAGVTLPESLVALTEQSESQRFKGILGQLSSRVNEGSSLADAMSVHPKVFSPLYVNMIRAGEASGALETVLHRLAEFMEKQIAIRGKVTSAMVYPAILAIISVVIIMVLMVGLIPTIQTMFADMGAALPWNTVVVVFVSNLLRNYWYILIALGTGLVIAARRYRASAKGRAATDRLFLRMPIFGDMLRKIAIARFTRTLSTLLASGVQLLGALDIVRPLLGNKVLEDVVTDAHDSIREGEGIALALKQSGEFPPLVTHMIAVGERSGQLEAMLADVADAYDRETDTAILRMTAALEPLMIVVMGGSIGFIVYSVMRPIMMLTQMAGR